MAFDGFHWKGNAQELTPSPPWSALAAARDAAERAWRATHDAGEDPHGPTPLVSSHPDRATTRETFRSLDIAVVEMRDFDEDDGAPFEEPFGD